MKNIFKLILIFLLFIPLSASAKYEKVSLQLDWKFQFQHAGFIMAKEKGFYEEVGLQTTLLEYNNDINIEASVLSQKVDFGISNTPVMIKNRTLQPTVILATYLHHSPLVFVTQPDIKKPSQLNGKKIMATDYEYYQSSLSLLMNHFFIDGIYIPHSFGIEEFKNKEVDAMSVFMSNEIYKLDKQKIPYNIIDPFDYGFTAQAMNLFSSYEFTQKNIKKIENFLQATKKGWQYAVDNTDETIKIIHSKYNNSKTIEELNFEAKVIINSMLLNEYEIGEVDKELLQRVHTQLSRTSKLLVNQRSKLIVFKDMLKGENTKELFFTKQESEYLAKKGNIRLCIDPHWMPFEGFKDGKYIGIVADYFNLVKAKTNLNIEIHPTNSWQESLDSVKTGKCDILGSALPSIERLKYMDFTDPYIKSPIVMITTMEKTFINNIEDLKQNKIGIIKGYAIAEILKNKYPDINIIDVDSIEDGMKKVERGELFGYIDNLNVTAFNIQTNFYGVLKVSARLNIDDELTIGSRNDEPLLNSIFQKVVENIDNSEVRAILNRWITVKESVKVDYASLWKIFGVIFIIFIIIGIYSYQLKLKNKELKQLSREDALTKIGNRLKLNEILENIYQNTQRYEVSWGVILLDIDNFKNINDTYGHIFGDEILKKFAQILLENIRNTDSLGRWGGEEFLIVCPNINLENLANVAEGLRKNIENDMFLKEKNITASFGVSVFQKNKNIEQIIDVADKNLYKAKSSGKNKVCFS
nr:diguanylate cyclase [uncultured Sulfurimonas sp.]